MVLFDFCGTYLILAFIPFCDAVCSFPNELRGVWISLYNGPMVFGTSSISGYNTSIPNMQTLHLNCVERNSTFYILKSSHVFKVFGHELHMYMCLEMEQQSGFVFQYYIRTDYDSYLNEFMNGHVKVNTYTLDEVCVPGLGNEILLVRNVSLMQNSLGSLCPQIIQGYYGNITQVSTENGMCSDGYFDSCEQSTRFKLDIDNNCSNMFGNTTFTCVHYIEDSGSHLYAWTNNAELYKFSPFGFFCMNVSEVDGVVRISIHPDLCSIGDNTILSFQLQDVFDECFEDATKDVSTVTKDKKLKSPISPGVIVVISLVVFISVTCAIIFVIHWQRKRLCLHCTRRKSNEDYRFDDVATKTQDIESVQ
ncbi:uncharacterized protein LOC127726346 [Mytilus californianus]|uniref:uncharacterized protein LOC127726346 n=1 Tax=Mytilus californianus TaxID=6549 RepID=UPI0022470E87|nr:uncharacterized protein LOC127726346 [Mytilus californianus]